MFLNNLDMDQPGLAHDYEHSAFFKTYVGLMVWSDTFRHENVGNLK